MSFLQTLRKIVYGGNSQREVLSNFEISTLGKLAEIPYDVILYILLFCTPKELCTKICLTNHSLNAVIQCSNSLWRQLYQIYAVFEMVPAHVIASTQDPNLAEAKVSATSIGGKLEEEKKKEKKSLWKQLFSELKNYWELELPSKKLTLSPNRMEVTHIDTGRKTAGSGFGPYDGCSVYTKRGITGSGRHLFRVQYNARQIGSAAGICSAANLNRCLQGHPQCCPLYFRDGTMQLDETNKNLKIANRVRDVGGKLMKVFYILEENDILGILVDLDKGTVHFLINGEEKLFLEGLETKKGEVYYFVLQVTPGMKFTVLPNVKGPEEVGRGAVSLESAAAARAAKSTKTRVTYSV